MPQNKNKAVTRIKEVLFSGDTSLAFSWDIDLLSIEV